MDLVEIAVIKRAIGLDGLCGMHPHGETLGRLKAPITVYIGENELRAREIVIESVALRQQGYVARFGGVADRTRAEGICGLSVYIEESSLPALDEGEYYHFHLKGMSVAAQSSGKKIGTVRDVMNLPSMDALDVVLVSGKDVVVPYNDQAVVAVDNENKVITVSDTYIEELL